MNNNVEPTFVVIVQCNEFEQPEFHYETEEVALEILTSFKNKGIVSLEDSITGEKRLLSPLSVFVFKEYAKLYEDKDHNSYKVSKGKKKNPRRNIGTPSLSMGERNRR